MAKIKAFEFLPLEQWRFTHRAKIQLARQKAKDVAAKDFQFENLQYQIDEYLRQWILRELIETYHYPEEYLAVDELAKTAESSKIVPVAIKNGKGEIVALVSTGYFGETDLDFENACHKLQNDLDTINTAFFGMVTDGKRLSCLIKSDGESITDCQSVEEFPTFEQLREFCSLAVFPNLKPAAHKFQKLPAPKIPTSAKSTNARKAGNAAPAVFVKADANYLPAQPAANSRRSAASIVGFVACLLILMLGGAWYVGAFGKSETTAPAAVQTAVENTAADKSTSENKPKTESNVSRPAAQNAPNNGPTTYDEAPQQKTVSRPEKSSKGRTSRGVNPDGSIKLSNEEIAIMQTRPAANPNVQVKKSKTSEQPQTTAQSGTMQKKRQIVQNPF